MTNQADKTITYAYDAIGQRAQMTNPDAGVTNVTEPEHLRSRVGQAKA